MSSQIWITADSHFSHSLMIQHRGFTSEAEHDELLIERWNFHVKRGDCVYHLGDFSLSKWQDWVPILDRLNGNIFHIKGNHDNRKSLKHLANKFVWCKDVYNHKFGDRMVFMSHYPHLTWPASHHGSIMLHGHSHGSCRYPYENMLIKDVGVDTNNFCPYNMDEILTWAREVEVKKNG